MYFVNTPRLLKKIFNNYTWALPNNNNEVYLTFDDGPHPTITPWVLNQLNSINAKATFYCIGNNAIKYPETLQQILLNNHLVANHTFNHLNGFKTPLNIYLQNIKKAQEVLNCAKLFRPPYGRITNTQGRALIKLGYKIIMWQVLSADFDNKYTPQKCLAILKKHTKAGAIIVFHDSEKAWPRLKEILPLYFAWLQNKAFKCAVINA